MKSSLKIFYGALILGNVIINTSHNYDWENYQIGGHCDTQFVKKSTVSDWKNDVDNIAYRKGLLYNNGRPEHDLDTITNLIQSRVFEQSRVYDTFRLSRVIFY